MPSDMTVGQVVAQDPVSMGRVTMELPVQVSIRAIIITRIIRTMNVRPFNRVINICFEFIFFVFIVRSSPYYACAPVPSPA